MTPSGNVWPKTHITSQPRHWMDEAACQGTDHLNWVPSVYGHSALSSQHHWMADTYCRNCPVRGNCKRFAEDTKSEGIWGGWYFGSHAARAVNLL